MPAAIRIGRILGIPIYLHLTFLLILPLFVYLFSAPANSVTLFGLPMSFAGLDAALWVKYAFGTAATVIFFATILVHEVAHSYLALRYGVQIKGITLMIFGGVSSMEEMPRKPGQEWRMAFAGPFSSFVIGAVSFLLMFLVDAVKGSSVLLEGVGILLGLMGMYNMLLAGFNMIPAFPMDGGRVLRAYFAARMPYIEATRTAARIGTYFAIMMGIFGIFFLNFFIILIALFIYIAATEEEKATEITEGLRGMTVGQIMTHDVQVVHPETTVQQLTELMLATKHMGFPVVDNGLVGIVTLSDTHRVPKEQAHIARVKDIMTRNVVTAPPGMDAAKALNLMAERRISRLVITEGAQIAGIVTQKDFLVAVDRTLARNRAVRWGQQFPPQPPVQHV